ncbi:CRTAC1 family protein [bacterium]|nr:CRTAC1 family protein [bacterium]MBU1072945.1 CRTAC1 family protein [bacterium]MBU1677032.1 CRTAC1 family protein [bacterium]
MTEVLSVSSEFIESLQGGGSKPIVSEKRPRKFQDCILKGNDRGHVLPAFLALISILLSPIPSHAAITLTPAGPGGGGWLYAGTFDPVDGQTMLIGTDMCGVFRTDDGGQHWQPWNDGLLSSSASARDQISYVQDLIGIHRNDATEYYAATLGGIYRAPDGGGWIRDTAHASFYHSYTHTEPDYTFTLDNVAIPFSCFAHNGEGMLYAGAGANRCGPRHMDNWFGADIFRYPGLGDLTANSNHQYGEFHEGESNPPCQYTVWRKNLDDAQGWVPYAMDCTPENMTFGAARDLSVARLDGTDYVVVSTIHGIFMHDGTTWRWLHTIPLHDDQGVVNPEGYYRENLMCWNVYLTQRGTLYAGMSLFRGDDTTIPGGVYRIFDVTEPDPEWHWVGDGGPINNGDSSAPVDLRKTMAEVGRMTRDMHDDPDDPLYTGATIWLMNVIEGTGENPDIILAGNRNTSSDSKASMLRGSQPYVSPVEPSQGASWSLRVYRRAGVDYMYPSSYGAPAIPLDMGYQTFWGTQVIDQPTVLLPALIGSVPQSEIKVLVQYNAMLHLSSDGGQTWDNVCGHWSGDEWISHGYDEMGTNDLDFRSDGRVIEANQDDGVFSSTRNSHEAWKIHPIPDDHHSSSNVEVWPDWHGGGELLLAVVGVNKADETIYISNALLGDPPGGWIDESIADVVGHKVGIYDLEMTTADIWFATYNYEIADVGHYGVVRGEWNYSMEQWVISTAEENLAFTKDLDLDIITEMAMDLEYVPATGRLFAATGYGAELYRLDSVNSTSWVQVTPQPAFPAGTYHIHELAASVSGKVLMFGVSPHSPAPDAAATIYRTENADAADVNDMVWAVFDMPVELADFTSKSPQVETLVYSPYDDHIVFLGINLKGTALPELSNVGCLHEYTGLWKLDMTDPDHPVWTYEFANTMAEGIVVEDIAFNPYVTGQLVIGTFGQGLYYAQVPPPPAPPPAAKYVNKSEHVTGLDYPGVPYSAITLDYDNDGDEDLFLTLQNGPPQLYRNTGEASHGAPGFERVTDAFNADINNLSDARGSAAADFDNDGNIDIFVAHEDHPMLLRNKGAGADPPLFENIGPQLNWEMEGQTEYWLHKSWAGSWGDFNADGNVDLLVTRADAGGAKRLLPTHSHYPFLLLANVWELGGAGFTPIWSIFQGSETAPVTVSSVSWVDIDRDGLLDVFVPSLGDPSETHLYHRTNALYPDEFSTRFPGIELGRVDAAVWADVNRDGLPDLAAAVRPEGATSETRPRLFLNNPVEPGTFYESTALLPPTGPVTDLRPLDFDLDGWIDLLVVADETTDLPPYGVHLLRNAGSRVPAGHAPYFEDVTDITGVGDLEQSVSGLAATDFLGDGDMDLYLGRPLADQSFYYSATAPDGDETPLASRLGVRLNVLSGANNRSGIGAVVTVIADDDSTTLFVDGGSGLGGQMSNSLRFGLGDHTEAVTVRTRWPGGFVQTNEFQPGEIGTVVEIVDETDPTVIADSLHHQVFVLPNRKLHWEIQWTTACSFVPDLDRVSITFPNSTTITYAPADANVTATTGRNYDGSYWHSFSISGTACLPGNYVYEVMSETNTPEYTQYNTASRSFSASFCAKGGEDDDHIIQE